MNRTLARTAGITAATLGLAVAGLPLALSATAHGHDNDHKVGVCHATSSDTNPYEWIVVDESSATYKGHLEHKNHPNKTWKSTVTWNGTTYHRGDAKPDFIGGGITQGWCEAPTTPDCDDRDGHDHHDSIARQDHDGDDERCEETTSPTPTPTETTPSETPTETPSETPTETPTETPSETPTESETSTPSETPTETPTEDPTDPVETGSVDPTSAPATTDAASEAASIPATGGGQLAHTGATSMLLTLLGLGIFALGVLATVASRRPTRSH